MMKSLAQDTTVRHERHGVGRVVADLGDTVVVRFEQGLEQLERESLKLLGGIEEGLSSLRTDDTQEGLLKAQALAIRSVNDQWGVFSRSKVQLLPHQLWVCRQVTAHWPARWLVADDVGLGKTIEAGLVLAPLMASGRVRRVLVLSPARLVEQWRDRMKSMFDIRLTPYAAESDRGKTSFWETSDQVVASFHTLRAERVRDRLLQSEPWDLVVVDEAHHFQAKERESTLTFALLEELQKAELITSLVLFTGTPHRGKDHGFLALMELVRPDLFSTKKSLEDQLPLLRQAMIRNNKAHVTDLHGKKLFHKAETFPRQFSYSNEEQAFYDTMSAFIADGRAYAQNLGGRAETTRMLVLISLQKLAASSVAAIAAALNTRHKTLQLERREARKGMNNLSALQDEDLDGDTRAEAEEAAAKFAESLLSEEIDRVDELIALAGMVEEETKIACIVALIDKELSSEEPVLLFTEYKATQGLMFRALEARFGRGCVGFINGDDKLIISPTPEERVEIANRNATADAFNAGRLRFLISTEAGGEGIDLQERCATLVHVDMPWNPMRLHQRVGRINRYGQTRPVKVYLFRNPDTVEAKIWGLLEGKLGRIQGALSAAMDDPEDIAELVIGMAGQRMFDATFGDAADAPSERLDDWFDAKTAHFGGKDAVATAKNLFGAVQRFDFQKVSGILPDLDLPDLEPFFRNSMARHGRRVIASENGLSVVTPQEWRGGVSVRRRYDDLVFDRRSQRDASAVLGIGHALIDRALVEAGKVEARIVRCAGVHFPILVVQIEDQVTGRGATIHRIVAALARDGESTVHLPDWELLKRLNKLRPVEGGAVSLQEANDIEALWDDRDRVLDLCAFEFAKPHILRVVAFIPATVN